MVVNVVPASHESGTQNPLVVICDGLDAHGADVVADLDDVVVGGQLEPVAAEVQTEVGQARLHRAPEDVRPASVI